MIILFSSIEIIPYQRYGNNMIPIIKPTPTVINYEIIIEEIFFFTLPICWPY